MPLSATPCHKTTLPSPASPQLALVRAAPLSLHPAPPPSDRLPRAECATFVPKLMEFHSAVVRKQRAPLQIVLVSFDHSEGEMARWMRSPLPKESKESKPMPWLAAPFGSPIHSELQARPTHAAVARRKRLAITVLYVWVYRSWHKRVATIT